ncbi:MarR family transcriptional regulator [Nonomuraea fuscirosea]|uniref:MarR family winged helix-turn-helix transcriptional regulator n=1 Tax=Nonomuraea fuscirosea TaxID=1291556 RepID=UPI002DDABC9D|nr:MarR family transcriptional regulator [Nonomuraea fuscirosea]WSA55155.1 MarR family transcriptional regulator [Nonomuraea fuscirosea]
MEDAESPIYDLIDLTMGLAERTQALIAEVLAELDLTHALANAVWRLGGARTPPSMRELAHALRCDPSTVTFLADRLEQRGLVTRTVDPANRRVKILTLTDTGHLARRRLVEAMTMGSPLARLSPDDQRTLRTLLSKAMSDRP